MTLLPMTINDIDEVSELDKLCFSIPWSRNSFIDELSNKIAHYYVLRDDDIMIGYCGVWNVAGEGNITNIAVHPDYRRKGCGSMLMERLFTLAKELSLSLLTLEVREGNAAAQALYRKYGFEILGKRPNYYADNREAAYIMTIEFNR